MWECHTYITNENVNWYSYYGEQYGASLEATIWPSNPTPGHLAQFSHLVLSDYFQPHGLKQPRLPSPSSTLGDCSDSYPSSQWCHPNISSSVIPLSSCLQCFSASGSFLMSQFFTPGGQSIGASALALVLSTNTQDWSPLGWTGWISLQSKGLSRVFFSTTVQKHQFFGTQPLLWSNSHMRTWLLKKQ